MAIFSKGFRRVSFVALLLAFGSVAYAYTTSATVNGGKNIDAGYGQGAISGFTASSIQYTLNTTTPDHIDKVQFNLSPAPTTGFQVWAKIANTWYSCNLATPTVCATTSPTQLTVEDAQNSMLQVSAAQ